MTFRTRWISAAVASASLLNLAAVPMAGATNLPAVSAYKLQSHGDVTDVRWGRGGLWLGPGIGAVIAGGLIVGGALTAAAIAEHRAEARDIRRCARDFPDFDRRSGTYVDRSGEVRVCPYLY